MRAYSSVSEKLSWFTRHLSDGLYIFHRNLWNLPSDIWAKPSEMSDVSDVFCLHCYSETQWSTVHSPRPCDIIVPSLTLQASKFQIECNCPSGKWIVKITCLNVPFTCLKYIKPMQLMWKLEIRSRPSDKSCRYSTCPTVIFTRLRRSDE